MDLGALEDLLDIATPEAVHIVDRHTGGEELNGVFLCHPVLGEGSPEPLPAYFSLSSTNTCSTRLPTKVSRIWLRMHTTSGYSIMTHDLPPLSRVNASPEPMLPA